MVHSLKGFGDKYMKYIEYYLSYLGLFAGWTQLYNVPIHSGFSQSSLRQSLHIGRPQQCQNQSNQDLGVAARRPYICTEFGSYCLFMVKRYNHNKSCLYKSQRT